jgi:hypothetical protein
MIFVLQNRYNPEMSAFTQMNTVFTTNAPDVLIYISSPEHDPCNYHSGLVLESIGYDYSTGTLHADEERMQGDHSYSSIRLRHKLPINNKVIVDLDRNDYITSSLEVVDEIVKQFDAAFVITIDGRKPTEELFETIKDRLMTMPLQRTVLPEIVKKQDDTASGDISENNVHGFETNGIEDVESESFEMETMESEAIDLDEHLERNNDGLTVDERNEQIRSMSEFNKLCPVNFSYGVFKLGVVHYCIKFMDKLYFFAGPEELQLFEKSPKQYLEIPRPSVPVRAIFYGPEALSCPAANAVSHLFGYNLIDVKNIEYAHVKIQKLSLILAIVKSVLKTTQEIVKNKTDPSTEINSMRNAIGEWIWLHFENYKRFDLHDDGKDAENEHNIFKKDFPNPSKYNNYILI